MRKGNLLGIFALLFSTEAAFFPRTVHKTAESFLASSLQQEAGADVDSEFDKFLESWFDDFLDRKPMEALRFGRHIPTCRGLTATKGTYVRDIWGDVSPTAERDGVKKDQQWLQDMKQRFGKSIGARDLSDESHVTYMLMEKKVEEMQKENQYSAFRPPFGPLGCQLGVMGCQVQVAGMIRGLPVSTVDDARCYVALLNGLPDFLVGHGQRLQDAADHGAPPYHLITESLVKDCDAKLPAEGTETSQNQSQSARSNDLFQAFEGKLRKVKRISRKETQSLLHDAEKAVINAVWPAYRGLRELAQRLLPKSIDSKEGLASNYGADARDFYAYRVQLLGVGGDASSLHERALKLVKDNAKEIRRNAAVAFPKSKGANSSSPAVVMQFLTRAHSDAGYTNSEDGRAAYLKDVQGYMDSMLKKLVKSSEANAKQRLFFPSDIPALPCKLERLQSPTFPGLAQYRPGSIGTVNRSAVVGFNVYDMTKVSKMDMEVLTYHEVVPGHHLQVTKALTLPLPSFRRYFGDEAFSEGWAVYAEQDISTKLVTLSAQSHLGRLNMLQTRAVRMAADTGIHALNWERKKAEAFYMEHTMITPERAAQAVDRHFAWPAQALTYAAGYEQMTKLRRAVTAKAGLVKALGKDWEAYLHKAILSHGDLPLAMLEQVVFAQLNTWSTPASVQSSAHHSFALAALLVSFVSLVACSN